MESLSALLALSEGNPSVTGGFPSQRPVTRGFDGFFICAWTNGWANNRHAGDLRFYRFHYDVTTRYIRFIDWCHAMLLLQCPHNQSLLVVVALNRNTVKNTNALNLIRMNTILNIIWLGILSNSPSRLKLLLEKKKSMLPIASKISTKILFALHPIINNRIQ